MAKNTKSGLRRFGGAVAAVVLSVACAGGQPFMPTERLTAFSPQGYLAAEYDLHRQREHLGQVRVWSNGAERIRFRGQRRALVHIGFEIQNESDRVLVLDQERLLLDSATVDGTVFENIEVAQIQGDLVIPPGGERRVDLYFAMIPGVYPTDIRAFRLRWGLRDDGVVYAQRTPFVQEPVRTRGYYYSPFYDPFYYGGWWGPGGMYMHPYPYFHYRMY
jgi:hypothetical protein